MSRAAHKVLTGSGAVDAYEIEQSLMFNKPDNPYVIRTPSSTGNRDIWTFSCWYKPIIETYSGYIFTAKNDPGTSGDPLFYLYHDAGNLVVYHGLSGANYYYKPNQKLRDLSGWYHIVLAWDTTQGTGSNRVKLWTNGKAITSWHTYNDWPQNTDTNLNWTDANNVFGAAYGHNSAGEISGVQDGYIAEAYLLDGVAADHEDFGKIDASTNQWVPIEYTGSYGTNGFYLKFVSGALGTDSSGNGNNFTATNLANSDVMIDTPTNNFNTFIDSWKGTYAEVKSGGLTCHANTAADVGHAFSSIPMEDGSGKWYAECRIDAYHESGSLVYPFPGVADITNRFQTYNPLISLYAHNYNRIATENTLVSEEGSTFTEQSGMDATDGSDIAVGAIINIAVDTDNKKIWYGINGTYRGSGNPSDGSNPTFTYSDAIDMVFDCASNKDSEATWNFGQNGTFHGQVTAGGNSDANGIGDFKYSVPTGAKALCTSNLPTPTIKKPSDHFETIIYSGTGSERNVTGWDFAPDLVWTKNRANANAHFLVDKVRGTTKTLYSNNNSVEETRSDGLTAFLSNGFTIGGNEQGMNDSSHTYVSWAWKANGSGSSNSDGAQTTTVSANTTAGFSIVKGTGTGSATTYGHGLGATPKVYISKATDGSADMSWWVIHNIYDGTWDYSNLDLQGNANSTLGSTGATSTTLNMTWTNTQNFIAYAFVEVKGFSSFNSTVGRGNADGPFVNTGFTPQLVIVKGNGGSWFMWDTVRDGENEITAPVWADMTYGDTADAAYGIDIVSNGFKIRGTNAGINSDTSRYIYMAWAETPFKYANAR